MPDTHPAEIERWVRIHVPETITLVLTAHDRDAYLADMMTAGVAGFLAKSEPDGGLIAAIRRAAGGEILFDSKKRSYNVKIKEPLEFRVVWSHRHFRFAHGSLHFGADSNITEQQFISCSTHNHRRNSI